MKITTIADGTPVKVKSTKETGVIIGHEIKRLPYINNGKEVLFYTVQLDGNKHFFEYESSDITTSIE